MSDLTGFLGPAYLWVKAAHVTFVIFWMAGLFLLPRFYVYHQETAVGSPEDRAWIEREARVRSIILTPAMIAGLDPRPDARLQHRCLEPGLVPRQAALVVALERLPGLARRLRQEARQRASGRCPARRCG